MKKSQGILIFIVTLGLIYLSWRWLEVSPEYLGLPPYLKINLRLAEGVFLLFSLLFFFSSINKELKIYLMLSSLSLFTGITIAFLFKDSEYGIYADWGDQGFLTSFLTKLAAFGYNADVFYKDLNNFYPPLYYYVLVLISKITGNEPYQMLKIGMLFSPTVIIFITYHLWKKLVRIEIAAIIPFSVLIFQDWAKVNAWIALVIFVPWWLYYLENIFLNEETRKKLSIWHFLKGGVLGALIIQLQYYWLFIGCVASSLLFFYQILEADKKDLFLSIKSKFMTLFYSIIFSLPYWGPYVHDLITLGSEPTQNRWYFDSMAVIPLPFTEANLQGAFFLLGLIYLATIIKKDKIALLLLLLTASAYLWIFLGYIAVLLKIPVLYIKTNYLINYLLAINSLYSLGYLFIAEIKISNIKYIREGLYSLGIILVLYFSHSFQNLEPGIKDNQYLKNERSTFSILTDGKYINKVVLASNHCYHTLFYYPTFVFQPWIHYAHPSALYSKRNIFLIKLGQVTDPSVFGIAIMNNRFNKVDYLYFDGPENKINVAIDSFPYPVNEKYIIYPDSLLSKKLFDKKEKGAFRLFAVKHKENILSKTRPLKELSFSNLITLYSLLILFREEITPDLLTQYKANEVLESIKQRVQDSKEPKNTILEIKRLKGIIENAKKYNLEYYHFDQKSIALIMEFSKD